MLSGWLWVVDMRQVGGSSLRRQIGLIVVTAAVCFLIQLGLAALERS